jgi:hypothetical protein
MGDSYNADSLIDEIDSGTLRANRHPTIRSLQRHIRIEDEDICKLIALHDAGVPVDADEWAGRLWPKIEALPLAGQGALRLTVGLLHPNDVLDWYEAEYFILWSRQQGVAEELIRHAFHGKTNVS